MNVSSEVGATWLELFVLFHLRGGNAVANKTSAQQRLIDTHAKCFREFQRRSKALFAFAAEDAKPLLKANLVRHDGNRLPLARYGLQANLSQLPFRLSIGDNLLHAALCSYSGRVPDATRIPTRLRSARFKSPRFAPWAHLANSSILPDAAAKLLSMHNHEQQHGIQNIVHTQGFMLCCPLRKGT